MPRTMYHLTKVVKVLAPGFHILLFAVFGSRLSTMSNKKLYLTSSLLVARLLISPKKINHESIIKVHQKMMSLVNYIRIKRDKNITKHYRKKFTCTYRYNQNLALVTKRTAFIIHSNSFQCIFKGEGK